MRHRLIPLVVAATLAVGACASTEATTAAPEAPPTTTAPSTTPPTTVDSTAEAMFPVDVTSAAGAVTIAEQPQRIAALSATHVEMLYAMGAGDQVIAGDLFSNYPPEALELTQVDSFNLNVEAVVALDPDLVVLTFDPGEVVEALRAVDIPVLLFDAPATLEAAYEQFTTLGAAAGHPTAAEVIVAAIQSDLAEIAAAARPFTEGVTYYHEIDPFSFFTPNSSSFIGRLYDLLGMVNIADEAPDEFGSGFPQLSPEFIIESDPNVIVLAAPGENVDSLLSRQGWDVMTAIRQGHVIELDPDAAGRWGPRIVDVLRAIADGVVAIAQGD